MFSTKQKIFIARLLSKLVIAPRKILGMDNLVKCKRGGINWELDLKEGIDLSIYTLGGFEPSTIKCYQSIIMSGDTVVDIGANIGSHTLPMAKLVGPNGLVISFEPTEFAYRKQINNIELNPDLRGRINANQTMLTADDSSQIPDQIHSSWPMELTQDLDDGHLGRLKSTQGSNATTLDKYVNINKITKVDFIKLDVDGFELDVLNGAKKTLSFFQPKILLELAPYVFKSDPHQFDHLITILQSNGYALFNIPSNKLLPENIEKLKRIIPIEGSINVLAIVQK